LIEYVYYVYDNYEYIYDDDSSYLYYSDYYQEVAEDRSAKDKKSDFKSKLKDKLKPQDETQPTRPEAESDFEGN